MAERYTANIKANSGYDSIPIVTFLGGEQVDLTQLQYVTIPYNPDGSTFHTIPLWKGGGGYIESIGEIGGGSYAVRWAEMTGCLNPLPNPPHTSTGLPNNNLFIGSYISGITIDSANLYVIWIWSDEVTQSSVVNVLYNNVFDPNSNLLESSYEWDEAPSDDPTNNFDNTGAIGGEFADTERFDLSDNISEWDLDSPVEMSYGKLINAIVLHENASQGYDLTKLNNCLFLADFWTNLKNKFEGLSDPISMIISTIELPFTPATSGSTVMKLGGITVVDSSDQPISVEKLGARYERISLGTINLKEVWGTEKDYTQSSVEIYLPYVGQREIDVDLAINYSLTLYRSLDRWTGDILYYLHASNISSKYKYMDSQFIAYRWSGNCAKQVPLGKVDNTSAILSLLGLPAKTIGATAMGGLVGGALATGGAILNTDLSPIVQSSGSVSGSIGRMDLQYPYLVIKRGVPVYPNNWRKEFGATRYQEFRVGDLAGYTEFFEIHADDISGATDSEKAEIENILKSGVIIN